MLIHLLRLRIILRLILPKLVTKLILLYFTHHLARDTIVRNCNQAIILHTNQLYRVLQTTFCSKHLQVEEIPWHQKGVISLALYQELTRNNNTSQNSSNPVSMSLLLQTEADICEDLAIYLPTQWKTADLKTAQLVHQLKMNWLNTLPLEKLRRLSSTMLVYHQPSKLLRNSTQSHLILYKFLISTRCHNKRSIRLIRQILIYQKTCNSHIIPIILLISSNSLLIILVITKPVLAHLLVKKTMQQN